MSKPMQEHPDKFDRWAKGVVLLAAVVVIPMLLATAHVAYPGNRQALAILGVSGLGAVAIAAYLLRQAAADNRRRWNEEQRPQTTGPYVRRTPPNAHPDRVALRLKRFEPLVVVGGVVAGSVLGYLRLPDDRISMYAGGIVGLGMGVYVAVKLRGSAAKYRREWHEDNIRSKQQRTGPADS